MQANHGQTKATPLEPWVRFCARYLDICIYIIINAFLARRLFPDGLDFFIAEVLLMCILLETMSLCLWNTTLGKSIAGIILQTDEGKPLSCQIALKRTILLWAKGMAFGLPLINFFAMWIAKKKLVETGTTDWDARYGIAVQYRLGSPLRQKIFVGVSGIFILLIYTAIYLGLLDYYIYNYRVIPAPPGTISSIQKLYTDNRFEEALMQADDYLKTHTPNVQILNIKGFILVKQGKNEEAIPYFLQAVQKDSTFAAGFNNLSWAYSNLHLYKLADYYANRALNLEPNDYDANTNKGNVLHGMKNYNEALKYFDIALKANSKGYKAYWGKGLCNYQLKEYSKTIECMNKHNEFCPVEEIKDTDNYIANSYIMLGDYQGAISEYKAQIARPGNDKKISAYFGLGRAYQKLQDYKTAITIYDQILTDNPRDADAHYEKSLCLIALGQKDAALEYLTEAIKGDQEYSGIAKKEARFQILRDDGRFTELVQ